MSGRVAAVGVAAAAAAATARSWRRLRADRQRYALIRGAALIVDSGGTTAEVIQRFRALLVPAFADECEITVGAGDHDPGATLAVPLRSRGRTIGTMALRGPSRSDREFAVLLGGRIALALENAQLESREDWLTTALGTLAEAVTIQDHNGALVYANSAAAGALGFASAEELLATPPQAIIDAYESFNEDGSPLRLEQLPARRLMAGESPGPLVVRAIHRSTGEERWRIVKATAVPGRRLAVNVIEDVTDVKRAELSQRFLAEVATVLASSLDYERTLAQIAELTVPRLADFCAVALPDVDRLRTVAVAHADPAKLRFARDYQQRYPTPLSAATGSARVLREGVSQLIDGITDELLEQAVPDPAQRAAVRGLGMRAAMIVPMLARGRAIGVITMVSAESGRRFAQGDLELAEELGRRAGTAVENARLYRERSHIAAALQRGLLPDELPDIPGLRLASLYRPAGEENLVGGDFYDAFATPTGWVLLVGDVTGRGADAASQTGQARHTLRTAGILLGDPHAALAQLNLALRERREQAPCTVALVHVSGRSAHVLCAGHPRPLLIRDGAARTVGHFGPMLGAWPDSTWRTDRVDLVEGDVLVLYTDGVTDTRGDLERFGDARLLEALRGVATAAEAVAAVDVALTAFQRGPQADDTAILALDLPPLGA
jgi:PAS domain S-box-containing protein